MTTRRGFLKGVAAAVGVVVVRPKLPNLLAVEPAAEVAPTPAGERLAEGVRRGSSLMLDNWGVSTSSAAHGIGAEAEIDGRRFHVGSFSLSMASPSMLVSAFSPEWIAAEPSADLVEMELWTKDTDLVQFLHRLSAEGGRHELSLSLSDAVYNMEAWMTNITGEIQADNLYHKLDLSFKCDGPIECTGPV